MKVSSIKKVNTGTKSFSLIDPKIWNSLTNDLKSARTLSSFKTQIKDFDIRNCPCSICKTYISGVGYLD